jgi:hypothetical protein
MCTGGSPPEVKRQGVELNTHFQLVPRFRIHGTIPPPPYVFMGYTDNFMYNIYSGK